MGIFDECLYFSSNRLARHMNHIADEAFRELNVTPTQGFTLIAIREKDLHTPTEIAAELKMDTSTITRFLDKVEKLGYVKRSYAGRKSIVDLTDEGEKELKNLKVAWRKIHDIYEDILGTEIVEKLSTEIIKANEVIDDFNR